MEAIELTAAGGGVPKAGPASPVIAFCVDARGATGLQPDPAPHPPDTPAGSAAASSPRTSDLERHLRNGDMFYRIVHG